MSDSSKRLTLGERCAHAFRVGALAKLPIGIIDGAGRATVPVWWEQRAPWYAGRLLEQLGWPASIDGSRFNAEKPQNAGLLWLGAYESAERYAVGAFLPRSLPVIEVGASIGVLSCLIDRMLAEHVTQVAVEANGELIPTLAHHRDLNRARFQIVHAAIAYGSEVVPFRVSDSNVSGAIDEQGSGGSTVYAPVTSLATLLAERKIPQFTLVCDIEGAEVELVRHEAHVLRDRAHTLIVEVHPAQTGSALVREMLDSLTALGFSTLWQRGEVIVLRNATLEAKGAR